MRTIFVAYAFILLFGASYFSYSVKQRVADTSNAVFAPPSGCSAENHRFDPSVSGADQVWQAAMNCQDAHLEVHIFRFNSQGVGKEATSQVHDTYPKTGRVQARTVGNVSGMYLEANTGAQFFAEWYIVGEHQTQSIIIAKLRELVALLTHPEGVAVSRVIVAVESNAKTDFSTELARLQQWIETSYARAGTDAEV